MLVDSIPETLGEGQELVSLHAAFTANGRSLPTCQTKRRVVIKFNKTSELQIEPTAYNPNSPSTATSGNAIAVGRLMDTVYDEWELPKEEAELAAWTDPPARQCKTRGTPLPPGTVDIPGKEADNYYDYYKDDSGYYGEEDSEEYFNESDAEEDDDDPDYFSEKQAYISSAATPQGNKSVRPTGLRVKVKCKGVDSPTVQTPPARSNCSVRLRVTLQMTGGVNQFPDGYPTTVVERLVAGDEYTCRPLTFQDFDNVLRTQQLNGGEGPDVDTQLCFPNTSPAGSPTIAAGAPWDEDTLASAVRFARYSSALHGCIPNDNGRTWQDIARWGGPTLSQDCPRCFKDGINFGGGLGGPPAGWETALLPVPFVGSYRDAAVVTTDTDLTPGVPAIVVTFRATVARRSPLQWASNIGGCFFAAGLTAPVRDSTGTVNPAAGRVCGGWAMALDAGGLYDNVLNDVQQRIAALSDGGGNTAARIFINGHSRGAALASYFTARLLLEQDSGNLGNYVGPFGPRGQISLYTFGGPRVGNPQFARFLEARLYERFRIINRLDPVTSGPSIDQGYKHVRPAVWFREGNAFGGGVAPLPATILYNFCVLTPAPQLSLAYNLCFDSCNNALVCTNVDVPPAVAAAGTLVPANAACQRIIDSTSAGNRQQISNFLPFIFDHQTYMGIDMDNRRCAVDNSVFAAGQNANLPYCLGV